MGFWTLKSGSQVAREQIAAQSNEQLSSRATGLDDVIGNRRKELDELEARSKGFMSDLKAYFGNHGIASFLTTQYNITTKYSPENEERVIGIKWNEESDDDLVYEYGFSFIEKDDRVRIDFTAVVKPISWADSRHVVADTDDDGNVKASVQYSDKLSSTRKFANYATWKANQDTIPAWFVGELKAHIRRLR